ncbi:hypothetical protein PLICRDRAFT_41227 [Plicaturopsis crispa FD-325 SS-3]|nr:hypothetical protein PLICRDRAFT_41227 [Plicaturopsis crispa FD-325 SS-3]
MGGVFVVLWLLSGWVLKASTMEVSCILSPSQSVNAFHGMFLSSMTSLGLLFSQLCPRLYWAGLHATDRDVHLVNYIQFTSMAHIL